VCHTAFQELPVLHLLGREGLINRLAYPNKEWEISDFQARITGKEKNDFAPKKIYVVYIKWINENLPPHSRIFLTVHTKLQDKTYDSFIS
jgi:hypothetical protein